MPLYRPQLAGLARRGLGAAYLPTAATLTLPEGVSHEDLSRQRLTAPEREAVAAQAQAAFEPHLVAARERSAMFGWDRSWAKDARWTDARLCLGREEIVPWTPACGGSPICEWGLYNVQVPCTHAMWARVMFQETRYIWAQEQLAAHLANKPPELSAQYARQWVQWTREVFRLVTLARWSTNISNDYYPYGERTRAKMSEIIGSLHPSFRTPAKVHPSDVGVAKNRYTLSLWMPRDYNVVRRAYGWAAGGEQVPQHSAAFDPVRKFQDVGHGRAVPVGATSPARSPFPHSTIASWPWRWIPRYPGSDPVAQMVAWFEVTLGSSTYWYSDSSALIEYVTRDCGFDIRAGHICVKQTQAPFHWGTARSTIAIATAMAEDIVAQPYAQVAAAGLSQWLTRYEELPPELQVFGGDLLAPIRETVHELLRASAHGASAILALGGAASAGFTTAVAAVLSGIVELLILFKAAAIGGGVLEEACLSAPVIRSIPLPDLEGLSACDFDTRQGSGDVEQFERLVRRVDAVRREAAAGLPVAAWLEASRNAERGNVAELLVPPFELPPPGGEPTFPWLGLGVAGAVLVGGVLLLRGEG